MLGRPQVNNIVWFLNPDVRSSEITRKDFKRGVIKRMTKGRINQYVVESNGKVYQLDQFKVFSDKDKFLQALQRFIVAVSALANAELQDKYNDVLLQIAGY